MPQFFVSSNNIKGNICYLTGEELHHLKSVRRIKVDDEILIITESNDRMKVKIFEIQDDLLKAEVLYSVTLEKPAVDIHIYIALLKGKNFDVAIQKAVEVGVSSITPIICERTIPKIEGKAEQKMIRWKKISVEAAKQSLRSDIPEFYPVKKIEDILSMDTEMKIIAHPHDAPTKELRQQLQGKSTVHLLIGPEGGFSHQEIIAAKKTGWQLFNFGFSAMRAETAAAVLSAICIYELLQQ